MCASARFIHSAEHFGPNHQLMAHNHEKDTENFHESSSKWIWIRLKQNAKVQNAWRQNNGNNGQRTKKRHQHTWKKRTEFGGSVEKRERRIVDYTVEYRTQQANNEYVSRDMNNELYRRQKGNIRIPADKRCSGWMEERKKRRRLKIAELNEPNRTKKAVKKLQPFLWSINEVIIRIYI